MTGSDVISDVRQTLLETTAAFWTDAELLRLINLGEQDYFNRIRGLEGKTATNSEVGRTNYDLPANWVSAVAIFYNDKRTSTSPDSWRSLEPTDIQELSAQNPNFLSSAAENRGVPTRYYLWNRTIYLHPAPDIAGDGNILMFFKAKPTPLTSTASSLNLDDSLSGAVRAYVLWHAWEKEKELGFADEQKSLYFQFVRDGLRWVKLRQLNKVNNIDVRSSRPYTYGTGFQGFNPLDR